MQLQRDKNSRSRGSITLEACITLPAFLSVFFLLLFLVKFTCTGIVLDYAVNETTKEIAASSYPISFVNELEDEKLEVHEEGAGGTETGSSYSSIFEVLNSESFSNIDGGTLKNILKDYGKDIASGLAGSMTSAYWDMKSAGKYAIAEALIEEHLKSPLINRKNVKLSLVEFPQSKAEYNFNYSRNRYKTFGLTPDKDFNSEDVVVQLEYAYSIKLPFIERFDVKMVHTAVERGWLNGSNGVLTSEDEGLDLEPEGSTVFITRTGIRYHKGSCWHLRRSRVPVDITEAKDRGYTPCKVCKPPG